MKNRISMFESNSAAKIAENSTRSSSFKSVPGKGLDWATDDNENHDWINASDKHGFSLNGSSEMPEKPVQFSAPSPFKLIQNQQQSQTSAILLASIRYALPDFPESLQYDLSIPPPIELQAMNEHICE